MVRTIVLKDLELQILLVASGVKGILGFKQAEIKEESRIPYLIHEMVRKGVVEQREGELVVKEPYRSIIDGIKNAKAVLLVRNGESKRNIEYLYLGTRIIKMSDSINDKNAIKLQCSTDEDVVEWLDVHFVEEKPVICPKELIKDVFWEGGSCKEAVELYLVRDLKEATPTCTWGLYEGKYQTYIKITDKDVVIYKAYEEWSNAEIVEVVNKKTGRI